MKSKILFCVLSFLASNSASANCERKTIAFCFNNASFAGGAVYEIDEVSCSSSGDPASRSLEISRNSPNAIMESEVFVLTNQQGITISENSQKLYVSINRGKSGSGLISLQMDSKNNITTNKFEFVNLQVSTPSGTKFWNTASSFKCTK